MKVGDYVTFGDDWHSKNKYFGLIYSINIDKSYFIYKIQRLDTKWLLGSHFYNRAEDEVILISNKEAVFKLLSIS